MSQENSVLKICSLSKSYRTASRELTVLRGIDFELSAGGVCAVVGPSGSGKTTLLGLCAGLDRPSEGSVILCGQVLEKLDEDGRARLRNREVGFVFQNFQLVPSLTALENVTIPAEMQGRRHGVGEAGRGLLDRVGLGDRLHHYPVQLSGGEQQRVALARAFINRPKILFADEPTGNLDDETSECVIELMFSLNRETGAAVMIVTHDWELARRSGRVIRLKSGEVAEDRRFGEGERGDPGGSRSMGKGAEKSQQGVFRL